MNVEPSPAADRLRPLGSSRLSPSRKAALQRRAMEAALASAMRALRSPDGRRAPRPPRAFGPPPGGHR